MNFTNIKCISSKCDGKDIKMVGNGGSFGDRISHAGLKCPECDMTMIVLPTDSKYKYTVSATTEEERREALIEEAKEKSRIALLETISKIKKRDV